jgi:hypothetical protein
MYIQTQTQSSTVPLPKRCDVTYPNSSDYEAYYDISFSLFHSFFLSLFSLSLSLSLENTGTKGRRTNGIMEFRREEELTCLVYSAAFLLNAGLSWRYWSALS